jgi:hypothetical protein
VPSSEANDRSKLPLIGIARGSQIPIAERAAPPNTEAVILATGAIEKSSNVSRPSQLWKLRQPNLAIKAASVLPTAAERGCALGQERAV